MQNNNNNQQNEPPGAHSKDFHIEQRHINRNNSESDDEILQKINKQFVLTNDYNRGTLHGYSKLDSSSNEEPSHEINDSNTNNNSILNNFANRTGYSFATRFSNTNDSLLEKPKAYFEYNKLRPMHAEKLCSQDDYYQKIDEDSDADDEWGEKPNWQISQKLQIQPITKLSKLNDDDFFYDSDESSNEPNKINNVKSNNDSVNIILKPSEESISEYSSLAESTSASSSLPSIDLGTQEALNGNSMQHEQQQDNDQIDNQPNSEESFNQHNEEANTNVNEDLTKLENLNLKCESDLSSHSISTNHFLFKDKNSANKILEGLNNLRLSKSMYDVILAVDGEEFYCHKCVLASLSTYFNAMFSTELAESKQSNVSINSIESHTMKLIVDYAYTCQLDITDNNVQAVLTAANLFDIISLKEACSRYMEWQMEDFNCIGILDFSDAHDCVDLQKAAFKYIQQNFSTVINHDEFLGVKANKLNEFISSDDLNVTDEEIVFKACITWLKHSFNKRSKEFYKVFENIRLPLLNSYFLYDKVKGETCLNSCYKCQELIQEAMMYNLLKDRRNQLQNSRTRSRKSFKHLEALVIIGGEDDSVVLRSVDAYFPSIDRWFPLQCSPYALSKHGIVSAEGTMLYMAGGEWPDQIPNETFWQFNGILDEWKELNSLLTPRSELGLAIVDGCVYAVGGSNGFENLSTVEQYDSSINSWKYCASMKYAVTSPAVCSLDGLLYVIGGSAYSEESEEQEVTNYFQMYDPRSDKWTELKGLKTPRSGCGSCAVNSKIYSIGGWQSSSTFLNMVECYDPSMNQWESCPSMISMRHKPGVAVLNNFIYVCGGETLFNYYHDSIEAYSIENSQWSFITIMNSGRSWLSCATLRLQNPLGDDSGEAAVAKSFSSQKIFHLDKTESS